jgi:hypothetical protein
VVVGDGRRGKIIETGRHRRRDRVHGYHTRRRQEWVRGSSLSQSLQSVPYALELFVIRSFISNLWLWFLSCRCLGWDFTDRPFGWDRASGIQDPGSDFFHHTIDFFLRFAS